MKDMNAMTVDELHDLCYAEPPDRWTEADELLLAKFGYIVGGKAMSRERFPLLYAAMVPSSRSMS